MLGLRLQLAHHQRHFSVAGITVTTNRSLLTPSSLNLLQINVTQTEFINCCWYLKLGLNFSLLGFAAFCY